MIDRFRDFLSGITICYKFIQRIKSTEMAEFGLRGMHVACLFYLYHSQEGLTSSELCTLCGEDKATISRAVSELRVKGYIEQSSGKSYRERLALTESGKDVGERMESIIKSWVGIGGDGLTDEQREIFYESLSHISANLRTKIECDTAN